MQPNMQGSLFARSSDARGIATVPGSHQRSVGPYPGSSAISLCTATVPTVSQRAEVPMPVEKPLGVQLKSTGWPVKKLAMLLISQPPRAPFNNGEEFLKSGMS